MIPATDRPRTGRNLPSGEGRRRSDARLLLLALEAGAIITAWPGYPRFASRRVDALTVARDAALGVAA